jgi:PEGA domain-containing protein
MLQRSKPLTRAIMLGILAGVFMAPAVAAPPSGPSVSSVIAPSMHTSNFGGVYYGGYGGYGGFGVPSFYGGSYESYGRSNFDSHWWAGPNGSSDPRQAGYNPSGGYPWESVATVILSTFPQKARIILDGVFVGTTNRLGPFELPVGEHTLKVESPGYEPSETVLKVEEPVVQQLDVRLSAVRHEPKPAPSE